MVKQRIEDLAHLSAGRTAVDDLDGNALLWSLAVVAYQTLHTPRQQCLSGSWRKAQPRRVRLWLLRLPDLLVRQRTRTINALRGHLAEYGVVAPQGRARIRDLAGVLEYGDCGLPEVVVELGREEEAAKEWRSRRRGRSGAAGRKERGKGKWSTGQDRKNQLAVQGLRARFHDLDPISRTPYGPAASKRRI